MKAYKIILIIVLVVLSGMFEIGRQQKNTKQVSKPSITIKLKEGTRSATEAESPNRQIQLQIKP